VRKVTVWRVAIPAFFVLAAAVWWGCQPTTDSRPARGDAAGADERPAVRENDSAADEVDASATPRAKGKAVFPEKVADLGDIIKGDQASHLFKVVNEGEGVLRILKARGS